MKKQKSYILVFMSLTMLVFMSCDDKLGNNSSNDPIAEPLKEIAIEISQEKTYTQYAEPIYESGNAEFMEGEYIQSLPQKMRMKKYGSNEQNDTIKSSEEIPVSSIVEINQKIYFDGSYMSVSTDKTTKDMNIFEQLNTNAQPENEKVAKTEIKNNVMYLYNPEGKLLKSEQLSAIDYKPMLDSLQQYLSTQQAGINKAPQQQYELRAKRALAQAEKSGMKIVSRNNDEIILEVDMGVSSSSLAQRSKSNFSRKAVMRFSPDLSRMYSQKIYEGNQLIHSIEISFADESNRQFSNSVKGIENKILPTANIKFIKQKRLAEKPDGVPFVINSGELYSKNSIKYNF